MHSICTITHQVIIFASINCCLTINFIMSQSPILTIWVGGKNSSINPLLGPAFLGCWSRSWWCCCCREGLMSPCLAWPTTAALDCWVGSLLATLMWPRGSLDDGASGLESLSGGLMSLEWTCGSQGQQLLVLCMLQNPQHLHVGWTLTNHYATLCWDIKAR